MNRDRNCIAALIVRGDHFKLKDGREFVARQSAVPSPSGKTVTVNVGAEKPLRLRTETWVQVLHSRWEIGDLHEEALEMNGENEPYGDATVASSAKNGRAGVRVKVLDLKYAPSYVLVRLRNGDEVLHERRDVVLDRVHAQALEMNAWFDRLDTMTPQALNQAYSHAANVLDAFETGRSGERPSFAEYARARLTCWMVAIVDERNERRVQAAYAKVLI